MSCLTIMLPAYNEEAAIGKVIDEIQSLPLDCKILVGDNSSSDRTAEVVRSRGIEPITTCTKGKGSTIQKLIGRIDTPYVVMANSDYTYPMSHVETIYRLLEMDHYDVVMGVRVLKEAGSMTFLNSLGNCLLSGLASILYLHRTVDLCTGMWGFRTETLRRFNIVSTGFTLEADLFSNAVKSRSKIAQIPIRYRARLEGSDTKLKVVDGLKIGWFLIKRRFS